MKNFQVSIYPGPWSITLIAILLAHTTESATLLTEDAESESPAVNSQTSTGYDVVQSEVAPEGSKAFHLTHTDSDQSDQVIQLNNSFTPGSSTYLFFESKIGWSSSTQVANVEVSSDNGANWINIWNKAGSDNSGDGSFTLQSISMAAYSGTSLQLRFRYTFSSGTYYPGTGTTLGWIYALATESSYDQPFITGVAYYDTDGNGFYDEGEGIGGITINVDGSPYHAVTPDSGGYAIPVIDDGAYTLSYTMPDGSTGSQSVTVSNQENIKADISPNWSSTAVIGAQTYQTNVEVSYSVAPVPAATAYQLWLWEIVSWPGALDAEDSSNIETTTTGSYSSIQDSVKSTGTKAYRLASTDATDQTLEIDYDILLGANSILSWQDQLGIIATAQEALVQISTDSGSNWTTLEIRNGTGTSGYATEFSSRSVSLEAYDGQSVRIRFQIHNPPSTSYYSQTSEAFGWYLDDINLSDTEIIKDGVSSEGPSIPMDLFNS